MRSNAPIRILCVDDHLIVCEGIVGIVGRQCDMEVVGTASTGEQSIELYQRHRPDVTLMDLQLPSMTGLAAIRQIRRDDPSARIVVLTTYDGQEDIFRALEAGAATYLLKDTVPDDLVQVIRDVHSGEQPLPPAIKGRLAGRDRLIALTPREVQVIELIAKGFRNKEVAALLGISEETVEVHVKHIFTKLEVRDRTAAVNVALRHGIIHLK